MADIKRAFKDLSSEVEREREKLRALESEFRHAEEAEKKVRYDHEDKVKKLEVEIASEEKAYDRARQDAEKNTKRIDDEMRRLKKELSDHERSLVKLQRELEEMGRS